MSNVVTGRFGGRALLLGGLLWIVGMLFHPNAPDMGTMASVNGLVWGIDHWIYLIGDLLLIAGFLLFYSHLVERGAEGWGALALAAGALAFTLDVAATSLHMAAFPAAAAAGDQTVYDALLGVQGSLNYAGVAFFAIAIAFLGAALLRAGAWRVLAYVGIILGAVELVLMLTPFFANISPWVGYLLFGLVPLWIALVGFKVAGTQPANAAAT